MKIPRVAHDSSKRKISEPAQNWKQNLNVSYYAVLFVFGIEQIRKIKHYLVLPFGL